MEGTGPPPADSERIATLPKVVISQDLVGKKHRMCAAFTSVVLEAANHMQVTKLKFLKRGLYFSLC